MTEQEMWEAVQRSDADRVSKGASSAMRGTAIYPSPVGDIQLDWEDGAVTALKNADADAKADAPNALTRLVFRQLDEYFAGTRKAFDFPYRLHGTPFQEAVWAALRKIPYGETRSYKDIAEAIGHPKAFGQLVWQITPIPFLSPSPVTASLGQADRLLAMAADWK